VRKLADSPGVNLPANHVRLVNRCQTRMALPTFRQRFGRGRRGSARTANRRHAFVLKK